MDKPGTIILLSDHRKKGQNDSAPKDSAVRTRPPALFFAGFLTFGALLAWVSHDEETTKIRNLPAEIRAALHRRTLDEIGSICTDTNAASGQLRDHCVSQARFLLSFPECNAACQSAVFTVLPHSHR